MDMENLKTVIELCECAENMYRLGWNECNGGNISLWLSEEERDAYLSDCSVQRILDAGCDCSAMTGECFLMTASGKYFKDVKHNPQETLGLVRIANDGKTLEVLWGFENGGRPTSEFSAHIMNHAARRRVDAGQSVVLHCHPVNLLAMTRVHELDEEKFTKSLWRTFTESLLVFPEGVGILPWMVCGTREIAAATAEKMADYRAVVWAHHGLFAVGSSLNEAFGLVETVEKAAEIYMKTAHLPVLQQIDDSKLIELGKAFGLRERMRWL